MPGTLELQRQPLVTDPGMHHGACMSGSLTRSGRENVPGIPSACATLNFTYLVRGPLRHQQRKKTIRNLYHYTFNLNEGRSKHEGMGYVINVLRFTWTWFHVSMSMTSIVPIVIQERGILRNI